MQADINISENCAKNTHLVVEGLTEARLTSKVLDIPCGAGAFTARLMRKNIEVFPADCNSSDRDPDTCSPCSSE